MLACGQESNAKTTSLASPTLIVFDLETTGLDQTNNEIVEIACWMLTDPTIVPDDFSTEFRNRCDVFYSLVMPSKPVSPEAIRINGIKPVGKQDLEVRGMRHTDVPLLHDVLGKLINWLRQFHQPVLIAHNCFKFDAPFLLAATLHAKLYDEFSAVVSIFGDTLPELAKVLPFSAPLSLALLSEQFIPGWTKYKKNAHSALFDVWATIKVMMLNLSFLFHFKFLIRKHKCIRSKVMIATRAVYSSSRFKQTKALILNVGLLTQDDQDDDTVESLVEGAVTLIDVVG